MSETVIKVENLSKVYRLGEIGSGTLRSDFQRWWAGMRGKEDPLAKVGHENDRSARAEKGETVFALRDINFEVKQGEVLGIIGKNGAGKSTLLKILSQVTTPTTGNVKVKGRIASLLEVGTGFHPELSGRENIFLNGAILGMTKPEIRSKFDEIVEFAGVAKYIDTPVKRYSSGMHVRLAFAVAAHLEPEILIVDEVLAVGDAEFQKKALGKMQDVSKSEGRTVLFVSHNLSAVRNLCSNGILLEKGGISLIGNIDQVVDSYEQKGIKSATNMVWDNNNCPGNDQVKIFSVKVYNQNGESPLLFKFDDNIIIDIEFEQNFEKSFFVTIIVKYSDEVVFEYPSIVINNENRKARLKYNIPSNLLNAHIYSLSFNFITTNLELRFSTNDLLSFELSNDILIEGYHLKFKGYVKPIISSELYTI